VLAIRTAAWAAAKELEVVPGSLKIRLAPRSAPTTRGEAAMAMLGDKSIRSERWVTARLSFSVLLRKWGHERETPLELEGTLALTTDQRVEYCEEETVELASGRKGRAARPAPPDPAPPVQLGAEGSLTGLGLSVASFSGELRALNGRAAEVLGLPTLGAPLDDAAWKRARKSEKAAAELKAEATRLRDQAGSLQEAVEVRFGLRLGKPWTGLQRALALLESALDHWREGRRRPCAEALERYEQWSHVVLLKVEEQLTAKGVYLGDTRTARPQPAPKEPAKP